MNGEYDVSLFYALCNLLLKSFHDVAHTPFPQLPLSPCALALSSTNRKATGSGTVFLFSQSLCIAMITFTA